MVFPFKKIFLWDDRDDGDSKNFKIKNRKWHFSVSLDLCITSFKTYASLLLLSPVSTYYHYSWASLFPVFMNIRDFYSFRRFHRSLSMYDYSCIYVSLLLYLCITTPVSMYHYPCIYVSLFTSPVFMYHYSCIYVSLLLYLCITTTESMYNYYCIYVSLLLYPGITNPVSMYHYPTIYVSLFTTPVSMYHYPFIYV